ncbi:TolC family protein [Flaviaesturariibacter amylovorans]|uniref:TolC family protein n=1 Tax=Flaviaesturariibacter amylovorans TaxID=1084520 RepID=A0ABP8HBC1_9BACT
MLRSLLLFSFLTLLALSASAQTVLTRDEAVARAIGNQRNLQAARLNVTQQQQLLRGAADLASPQITAELTPYEPLIVGMQQTFNLPGVYRNRRNLQSERIRLAELQLQGTQYDLKREVRLSYLQAQFLTERIRLLSFQDSVYQAIKISSQRFFAAGQINKLEELNATTQADRVRNELQRAQTDLSAEMQILRFYTAVNDSIQVARFQLDSLVGIADTVGANVQQQILQQHVGIAQRELQLQQSEQGPQFYAGPLFPTTQNYERFLGFQAGISIPIWGRQNRSRIAAGRMAVQAAQAQQDLERQRLNARYRQALLNLTRERQSLDYYNQTALPQAQAIMEVSRRLFQGGELNYIESLRNLSTAFDIQTGHLDTHRAYEEALIELHYLNGTL